MKLDDETLMRFHDGELDAEGRRRVRVARLCDPGVAARLEGLEQLGQFVRLWAQADGASALGAHRRARDARARARSSRARVCGALGAGMLAVAALASGLARDSGSEPLGPPAQPARSAQASRVAPLSSAVAVESVDFGSHDGAIFLVQSARTETTVVWLEESAAAVSGTL